MKTAFLLWWTMVLLFCFGIHAEPVYRTTISNLHINSFAQDDQGFVWVATAKGLCRYTGSGFDVFEHHRGDRSSLPSDNVLGLYADSRKRLWVATGNGLCLLNGDRMAFTRFQSPLETSVFLFGMLEYQRGLYAYGLGGIYKVNESKLTLEPYLRFEGREVWSVCPDAYGNLWCVCDKGEVVCIDAAKNLLRKFDLGYADEVYCALPVMSGRVILLGTKRGVLKIDARTRDILSDAGSIGLNINKMIALPGQKNILAIGTKNAGLVFYNYATGRLVNPAALRFNRSENMSRDVRSLFVDNNRRLWVGTFDKGFSVNDAEAKLFNGDGRLSRALHSQFVTRVAEDASGNLWIGTRYDGLMRYNPADGSSAWFNSKSIGSLSDCDGNFVQSLLIDSKNRLWAGYDQSLLIAGISGGTLHMQKMVEGIGNVVTMAEDPLGRMWVGKSSGGIAVYDSELSVVKSFNPVLGANNITSIIPLDGNHMLFSVFGDNIYKVDIHTFKTELMASGYKTVWESAITLKMDRAGNIWIGTYGNGLLKYCPKNGLLLSYARCPGFASSDIIGIAEDKAGNMWLSSSYGIYRLNTRNNHVQGFFEKDGTEGNQQHEKSVLESRTGLVFFGGNGGLTEIIPQNMRPAERNIPVFLLDFKLFNHSVKIGAKDGILSKDISRTKEIRLRHDQNVFSIDFTALNYSSSPVQINYAYRLVGFDKEWNNVGTYQRASYSNLPPGDYEFEVMVQNKDGLWSAPQRLLRIEISSSPWLHPLALCLYVALAVALLYYILRIYVRLRLGHERYEMAQKEIAREKSVARMKMNFFTNISHELRTPLTMIYGPVKTMLRHRGNDVDPEDRRLLTLMERNAERLLRLVNQLLDFDKVTNETLELKVGRNDCVAQLKSIINVYRLFVADKNITVTFNCHYNSLNVVYDPDKLDKIMNNLLSNAAKYTPMDGHVSVSVELISHCDDLPNAAGCSAFLEVCVEDDGMGLDKAGIGGLFGRFNRLVKGIQAQEITGTGIGLNFVKHLVENHKGTIKAENANNGGSRFTFVIPVDDSAYTDEEHGEHAVHETGKDIADNSSVASLAGADMPDADNKPESEDERTSAQPLVLVVDDNREMCTFLREMLVEAGYEVALAENGVEGLQKATELSPDVVVSDVVMPQMDGLELCAKIKGNPELSHIPVVLLTARGTDANRIEGYGQGADNYVSKPFNPDVLLSIIHNLIQSSELRRKYIMEHSGLTAGQKEGGSDVSQPSEEAPTPDKPAEPELGPIDQRFLKKLYEYIDANISNSDLNVNLLGKELGFSRTNFYRKVKALTGVTPNDFLRVYRLNRASELIKTREYTLCEISEMAGFGTQSHFSTSFKKHFGVSPKDYLASLGNK